MIFHDTTFNGVLVERVVDNGDGTGVRHTYEDGVEVATENLVGLPVNPLWPSLDSTGALATLLVVEGVLPLADAANAIHEEPEHLVHEAEAWSLGA